MNLMLTLLSSQLSRGTTGELIGTVKKKCRWCFFLPHIQLLIEAVKFSKKINNFQSIYDLKRSDPLDRITWYFIFEG